MVAPLTTLHDIAVELLECARAGLETWDLPAPCRVCVVPGAIAWDDCSSGGQLVISRTDVYYSTVFPADSTEDASVNISCNQGFPVALYALSLVRCAPGPVTAGPVVRPPTCEALAEAALLLASDSYAIRSALLCCVKDMESAGTIVAGRVGRDVAVGPEGGCVGLEIQILIGVTNG